MKRHLFLSSLLILVVSNWGALPAKAQACPYKLSYRYVYNAYTRKMENRSVYEVDYANCNRTQSTTQGNGNQGRSRYTAQVTTRGSALRLRSGPGLQHRVVGTAVNGSRLALTGKVQGVWVETQDRSWAHSAYLK